MKLFIGQLALLVLASASFEIPKVNLDEINHISQEFVDNINKLNTTFKAQLYPGLEGLTYRKMNQRLGALRVPHTNRTRRSVSQTPTCSSVPTTFSSYYNFPNCESVVGQIQDQGTCGDCWAVSTASAITDRRCIASGGAVTTQLSAWDLTSCCTGCMADSSNGCGGGYPVYASQYYYQSGIATGGAYNSNIGCKPFPLSPSTTEPTSTPCYQTCQPGYNTSYSSDKQKCGSTIYATIYSQQNADVQCDIMTYGSVVATFYVYEDFYSYSSGIYQYTSGSYIGMHAVRLTGWGTYDGVNYWEVANSWGTSWGENGWFYIVRGANECSFESDIVATYA